MKPTHGLNAASPLVLNLASLPQAPGSDMPVQRTIAAPEDFGTDVIAVPMGEPIELDARATAVSEGVLLSGSAQVTAVGECTRCLEQVTEKVSVSFQELYYYPERAEAALASDPEADPQDFPRLNGDLIDMEPLLRDVVIPALPFTPLCRVDCPGLCSECGVRLADVPPGHHHEVIDPRWAGLEDFTHDEEKKRK